MDGNATVGAMFADSGADVNKADNDGNTALHWSCIKNKRLVTSMLLWGGADRDAVNKKGNTALHE